MKAKSKPIPSLHTDADADAQRFVDTADLSVNDPSGFKSMNFEFDPKAAALNMRLPQNLLDALKVKVKATAKAKGYRTRAMSGCCLKALLRADARRRPAPGTQRHHLARRAGAGNAGLKV